MLRRKPIQSLLLAGIAAAVFLVALVAGASSRAATSSAPFQPFTYTAPTGPELGVPAIEAIAIKEAQSAGEPRPTQIVMAQGTFAALAAVMELSANVQSSSNPTVAAWLNTPAYLVQMHGQFSPTRVPVPPGRHAPTGRVYEVILDAHTGVRLGRSVGAEAESPDLGALGLGSAQASIVHEIPLGALNRGLIAGIVHGKGIAKRRVFAFQAHRKIAATITDRHGRFFFRLHYGLYRVVVRRPNGSACASKRITVRPLVASYVGLSCRT